MNAIEIVKRKLRVLNQSNSDISEFRIKEGELRAICEAVVDAGDYFSCVDCNCELCAMCAEKHMDWNARHAKEEE